MFTPENNRIVPTRRDSSVAPSDEDSAKRKPPKGDFEKVASEVDQREPGEDSALASLQKNKKKVPPARLTQADDSKDEGMPLLSPFQLVRGQRDHHSDEEKDSSEDLYDGIETVKTVPDIKLKEGTMPPPVPFEINVPTGNAGAIETARKSNLRYGVIEQPDLATVNSLGQQPLFVPSSSIASTAPVKQTQFLPSIQEVIDQIVEKVYTP